MAIAAVGTPVTNAFHTGANSFNVASPGTLVASDVVVIMIRHTGSGTPAFACSGFTNVFSNYFSGTANAGVCALVGTGFTGTPTHTVTSSLASGDGVAEACFAYSGASSTALVSAGYAGNPGGSNVTVPGVTFAGTNGRAIIMWQQPFVASPRTVSPAMTTVAAWNTSCYAADLTFASSGATGSFTVTNSSTTTAAAVIIGLEESTSTTTGTIALTDAPDTANFTGTLTITGTIAVTDANDTSAISGTETISGTIAVTDANDTSVFSGATADVIGSIAVTEANDTAALAGTETITGSIAVTDANDTPSITGTETISGTIAVTEAVDVAAFSGAMSEQSNGTIALTEADDTAAFTGTVDASSVTITGTLAAVAEHDYTVRFTGTRVGRVPAEYIPAGPIPRRGGRRRYFNPERNIVYGPPPIPPPES